MSEVALPNRAAPMPLGFVDSLARRAVMRQLAGLSRGQITLRDVGGETSNPAISFDLQMVMMGNATDFLSYFVMGTEGTHAFTSGGIVNTDDNLYLEFSAPFSYDSTFLEADNMASLLRHRESIIPYLADPGDASLRQRQVQKWRTTEKVFPLVDEAHTLILRNKMSTPEFRDLMKTLDRENPYFAPWTSMRGGIGG